MSAPSRLVHRTSAPELDDDNAVDVPLIDSLFELALHDTDGWLDAAARLRRAQAHRHRVLHGLAEPARRCGPSVEDDLWYSACVIAELLGDLGLSAEDVSTAFDLIGLPGEGLVRTPRAVRLSRARLEAAVHAALVERRLETDDERDLGDLDDLDDLDGSDSLDGDSRDPDDAAFAA